MTENTFTTPTVKEETDVSQCLAARQGDADARKASGISDLHIISSPDPNFPPPHGFGKLNIDLNQGAGGKYIYLCYRYGVGYPISDLYVAFGGSPDVWVPAGYTKIDVDLNEGAGGDYIYLCYRKMPDDRPIINLMVISGGSADIQPPTQYTKIPVDLNRGAGGAYIYLCFQKG